MLFPLDPYLLRRSAKLLDLPTSYLHWQQRLQPSLAVGETAVDEAAGEPGHGSKATWQTYLPDVLFFRCEQCVLSPSAPDLLCPMLL